MRGLGNLFKKYKQAFWTGLIMVGIYCVYRYLPYCLMERPVIREMIPNEIMENTAFSAQNTLQLKGEHLENIIGVYINGICDEGCEVLSNTGSEVELRIPAEYFLTSQKLDIQVEVRINSDLTCLSGKSVLTILSDDRFQTPVITGMEPEVLRYDGDLQQDVILYGENFTADSVVSVDGVYYAAWYDTNAGTLNFSIPYTGWCGKSELALQVTQQYNGYPTGVASEKRWLEASNSSLGGTQQDSGWTEYRVLADSLGEWNGMDGCNAREAFVGNYERGQRLFGIELMFSSDGVLFGKHLDKNEIIFFPDTFHKEKAAEKDYTLLSIADICELLQESPEAYLYVNLQEADSLEALEAICNYMLSEVEDTGILDRLILPVRNSESYHLLMELYPFANVVYVPEQNVTEEAMLAFVELTGISAAILPMDLLAPDFLEQLQGLGCLVYASGVKESDVDADFFARGIHGFTADTIPVETCARLVEECLAELENEAPEAVEPADENQEIAENISDEQTENIENMIKYLRALDSERYLVLISAKDDASTLLTADIQKELRALGLREDLQEAFTKSYLAVLDRGEVVYEALSEEVLVYDGKLDDLVVHAESAGYYAGNYSIVQLDGMECSVNWRGMNIVVYDRLLNGVMDSVCFDMFDAVKMIR